MAITSFTSTHSTCVSSTADGNAIYVFPQANSMARDKATFFLNATGPLSGTIGTIYKGTFYPMSYVAWTSANDALYAEDANIILPTFPRSIFVEHHNNFGQPCLRLDTSGSSSVAVSGEAGI